MKGGLLLIIVFFVGLSSTNAFADTYTPCVVNKIATTVINLDGVSMYRATNNDHGTYFIDFPIAISIPNPCGVTADPANILFPAVLTSSISDSNGEIQTGLKGVKAKYFLHNNESEYIHGTYNLTPLNDKILSYGELTSADGAWGRVALTVYISHATMKVDVDHNVMQNSDIDFSIFPHIMIAIHDGKDIMQNIPLMEFSFTGKVHLVQASCTTPNYNYDLGDHSIKEFNGIHSVTNWVDTAVDLPNCNFAKANSQANRFYTNTVNLTLTPKTSWLDQTQGIVSIVKGTGMADGVGIQLGEKLPSGSYAVHNGFEPFKITPKANTTGSIIFPLAAHYIQTESQLHQGNANVELIYTINYQ